MLHMSSPEREGSDKSHNGGWDAKSISLYDLRQSSTLELAFAIELGLRSISLSA